MFSSKKIFFNSSSSILPSNKFFELISDQKIFNESSVGPDDIVVPDFIKQPSWSEVLAGGPGRNYPIKTTIWGEQVFGIPKKNKVCILYSVNNDNYELNVHTIEAPLLNNDGSSVGFGYKVAMRKFINYEGNIKFEIAVSAPFYKNENGVVGYIALYSNDYSSDDTVWHLVGSKCGSSAEQCVYIPTHPNDTYWPDRNWTRSSTRYDMPEDVDDKPIFKDPQIGRDFLFYDHESNIIAGVNGDRNESFEPIYATKRPDDPFYDPEDPPIVVNHNHMFRWGSLYKLQHAVRDGIPCGIDAVEKESNSRGLARLGDVGEKMVMTNAQKIIAGTIVENLTSYYFISSNADDPQNNNTNCGRVVERKNIDFASYWEPISHSPDGLNRYEPVLGVNFYYGDSYEKLGTSVSTFNYPNIYRPQSGSEVKVDKSVFFGKDYSHPVLNKKTRIEKICGEHPESDVSSENLYKMLPTAQESEGMNDGFGKIIAHFSTVGNEYSYVIDSIAIFADNYIKLSGNSVNLRNLSDLCDTTQVDNNTVQVLNNFPTEKVVDARINGQGLTIFYSDGDGIKVVFYRTPLIWLVTGRDCWRYDVSQDPYTPINPRIPIIRF